MKAGLIAVGQFLFTLAMYSLVVVYFGLACIPAGLLVHTVWHMCLAMPLVWRCAYVGFSLAGAWMLFGMALVMLVGATRMLLRLRLQEGNYPLYSWTAIKWASMTSLSLMVNFTFANFILLTPCINLLYRMLGARIGSNVQINSKYVFDHTLLEIGDNTVVGGWAFIVGHVVEHGVLKLKKVKIGKNVTIGTHAKIMPGCFIGDNAIIGASAVLLKDTKVDPGAVYYGIPAQQVKPQKIVA